MPSVRFILTSWFFISPSQSRTIRRIGKRSFDDSSHSTGLFKISPWNMFFMLYVYSILSTSFLIIRKYTNSDSWCHHQDLCKASWFLISTPQRRTTKINSKQSFVDGSQSKGLFQLSPWNIFSMLFIYYILSTSSLLIRKCIIFNRGLILVKLLKLVIHRGFFSFYELSTWKYSLLQLLFYLYVCVGCSYKTMI